MSKQVFKPYISGTHEDGFYAAVSVVSIPFNDKVKLDLSVGTVEVVDGKIEDHYDHDMTSIAGPFETIGKASELSFVFEK